MTSELAENQKPGRYGSATGLNIESKFRSCFFFFSSRNIIYTVWIADLHHFVLYIILYSIVFWQITLASFCLRGLGHWNDFESDFTMKLLVWESLFFINIYAWEIHLIRFQELRDWQRCCATPHDHLSLIMPLIFRPSVTPDDYLYH